MTDCNGCPLDGAMVRRDFLRAAFAGALYVSGLGIRTDKAYPIPAANGAVIDKDESVIVARVDQRVFAFSLACPHQNTALRWDERNTRFQCPKHKSRYRPDGTFIEGRATRGLDRFAVRREADRLMVNFDLLYREDEHVAQWAQAFVSLADSGA
ncbi:MAG: Rieske (2Fe-2S) protein [Gemmatimonadaceae bacterium]